MNNIFYSYAHIGNGLFVMNLEVRISSLTLTHYKKPVIHDGFLVTFLKSVTFDDGFADPSQKPSPISKTRVGQKIAAH